MKRIQKRRRRENRTGYKKRLDLLKSERPRVVFRLTNKQAISQYVTSSNAQDKVEISLNSQELMKYGWPKEFAGSLKSITACYLTGYLMGKKILKENPILDFGMLRMLHKARPYAFIKGLIDAGVKIPCKEEAFPEEERIKGKSMKKDFSAEFEKIKSEIDSKEK